MSSKRFLTKSRFKVGAQCPTKLYYLDRPEYANANKENTFLESLAEGGFQVGALAQLYFPAGTEVISIDKRKSVAETSALLEAKKSTVFEAAFQHDNLFLRADVIEKNGTSLKLIEVKAKSFDPIEHESFFTKKGTIKSEWEEYLLDVAFQKYVIQKCYPKLIVTAYLMFVDKTKVATVDGLNQNFLISKDASGRSEVKIKSGIKKDDLGEEILIKINVDAEIDFLWQQTYFKKHSFADLVANFSKIIADDLKVAPAVGQQCKSCEFRTGDSDEDGLKSGFAECWSSKVKNPAELIDRALVFDVWNFRKAEKMISQGILFADELTEDDISPSEPKDGVGLSQSQRQWLQVQKEIDHDKTPFVDYSGLKAEMESWTFPIHCIDFETTMVALPFNKGRRPYEQMAFQFSHHTLTKDGVVTHKNQYINQDKGKFPNFDFLRALKIALSEDEGTILRFAAHENTVLCQIRKKILDSESELADAAELIQFIESITSGPDEKWVGSRNMVDLCELVKKFYYHPKTKGSNSIKKVLPAILYDSKYLQKKYSEPIYGSSNGIASLNYKNHSRISIGADGKVQDPYKCLPPIFEDFEFDQIESLIGSNTLADGGAAMTAYAKMQFSEMTKIESDRIVAALLKYCELDTFAMIMIIEYWQDLITNKRKQAA